MTNYTCDRFNYYKTDVSVFIDGYEGIPHNIILNLIFFLLFLIVWNLLKNKVWKKSVPRNRNLSLKPQLNENDDPGKSFVYNPLEIIFSRVKIYENNGPLFKHTSGWRKSLPNLFLYTDNEVNNECGYDAVLYQRFQRHLLLFFALVTFFSMAVIFPVHLLGKSDTYRGQFALTTISNLDPQSSLLWIHFLTAVFTFLIGILIMLHFIVVLRHHSKDKTSQTLMITGIPKHACFVNYIERHFREAYPKCPIKSVEFVYNVRNIYYYKKERDEARACLEDAQAHYLATGEFPLVIPSWNTFFIGSCLAKLGFIKKVNAIEFYQGRLNRFNLLMSIEKPKAMKKRIGIAFVTFKYKSDAFTILHDHTTSCSSPAYPSYSSMSIPMKSSRWSFSFAPAVNDIHWYHMCGRPFYWYLRLISGNLAVFAFAFFISTPTYLIEILFGHGAASGLLSITGMGMRKYLIANLLLILALLIPKTVYYAEIFTGHWTYSDLTNHIFIKTYLCFLFMNLVLPSLGMTSMPTLLKWFYEMISAYDDTLQQTECIFEPAIAGFFINFIIASASIGSICDLSRLPDLATYFMKIASSRSTTERKKVSMAKIQEFDYATGYAWILTVLTISMAYFLVCPIVTVFGLIFFISKYLVDRYNFVYAYNACVIDARVHQNVVLFSFATFILPLLNLFLYLRLKVRREDPLTDCVLTLLMFFSLIFLIYVFITWFSQNQTFSQFVKEPEDSEDISDDLNPSSTVADDSRTLTPQPQSSPIFKKTPRRSEYCPDYLRKEDEAVVQDSDSIYESKHYSKRQDKNLLAV